MVIITITQNQITAILGLVIITQNPQIIITHLAHHQVVVFLDQVPATAHHQIHHFQEVVVESHRAAAHQEVANQEDNFKKILL